MRLWAENTTNRFVFEFRVDWWYFHIFKSNILRVTASFVCFGMILRVSNYYSKWVVRWVVKNRKTVKLSIKIKISEFFEFLRLIYCNWVSHTKFQHLGVLHIENIQDSSFNSRTFVKTSQITIVIVEIFFQIRGSG